MADVAQEFRATHLFPHTELNIDARADGSLVVATGPLTRRIHRTMAAMLADQAAALGDKTFIAERGADGDWQRVSYAAAKQTADRVAGWFAERGRSDDRVLIVTGNSTAHAELVLGAAAAGVPVCPVSPQYTAGAGSEHARLRHVVGLLMPTVVFAEQVGPIAVVLREVLGDGVTVICRDPENWPGATSWDDVRTHPTTADPDGDIAALAPDTHLRYMLTSGSTGLPKIVIQTHKMWCTLAASASQTIGEASGWGVRTLDWMPWSHVSGISVVIGALVNGGTFYLDEGRPTPDLFPRTLANIAEVQPLFFANVPFAFGMLCDALEADRDLRRAFYEHLQLCLYGGAGLAQPVYDRFQRMAEETIGEKIMFTTGYGSTETTAGVMSVTWPTRKVGVGLPLPGVELKLVPVDAERYEVRFRSDTVMPGYLDNPEATATSFDDEGFYRSGDTVSFIDRGDPSQGFAFAGRTAEEFKLSTGTFVPGGRLHNEVLAATSPVVAEVVVCGEMRDEVGVLLWLNPVGTKATLGAEGPMSDLAVDDRVLDWIGDRLGALAGGEHGSAARVARFAVLVEPPVADLGEVSEKGSINQSLTLRRRQADVERLYATGPGVRRIARR